MVVDECTYCTYVGAVVSSIFSFVFIEDAVSFFFPPDHRDNALLLK